MLHAQAELDAERLNAACDALAEAALQRHKDDTAPAAEGGEPGEQAAADPAGQGGAASRPEVVERESTQQLLERAQAAEQVWHSDGRCIWLECCGWNSCWVTFVKVAGSGHDLPCIVAVLVDLL
jgi:hypothetical protein